MTDINYYKSEEYLNTVREQTMLNVLGYLRNKYKEAKIEFGDKGFRIQAGEKDLKKILKEIKELKQFSKK